MDDSNGRQDGRDNSAPHWRSCPVQSQRMPDSSSHRSAADFQSGGELPESATAAPISFCIGCGYELRGISSLRCPECGLEIDPGAAATEVPWAHRRQIGRVAAFYRTVIIASFRPKRLAAAVAGPVDARASRQFRWVVCLLLSVPLAALLIAFLWRSGGPGVLNFLGDRMFYDSPIYQGGALAIENFAWELTFLWIAGATHWVVLPFSLLCAFPLMTVMARPWFRASRLPAELQSRGLALANYTAAPLMWLWLPIGGLGLILAWQSSAGRFDASLWEEPLLLLRLAAAIVLLLWYAMTLRVMVRVTHCGFGRLIAAGILLPVCWVVAVVLALAGVPIVVGLIWIIFDSLR